ncbi:MAG: 30S ribosome-binding factor RbfA [bacterium]|nr:30S ribosome-binding factor RbfA [bacterium]
MSRRRWGDPLAGDPSRRQARVNDLLRRQISLILERRFTEQLGALVTVTAVRTTGDLRHARVYVAVLAEKERQLETVKHLHHAVAELRQLLASEVILKYVPSLEFILDDSTEKILRIEELLQGDKSSETSS